MLSNSRAAYRAHNHQRCIDAAMSRAHERCAERRARLTPIREAVLALIWQSHRPLGAYAIADKLPPVNGKKVQAPSIYRAIDFLLELGLIHRLPSQNSYLGCPFPDNEHSDVFMVCRGCGSAAEVSADALNQIIADTSQRSGFLLESQCVELTGLCLACRDGELP